jgi:hypothetical protein
MGGIANQGGAAGIGGIAGIGVDAGTCPCSLWDRSTAPASAAFADPQAVEVGVRFRTSIAGRITAVRFYKGFGNLGAHVGNLWASDGTHLGSVDFVLETPDGWQTAVFAPTIQVIPGQPYIASYYAPQGHYAADAYYFSTADHVNGPLTAPASAASNGNEVFVYSTTSKFPTETFQDINYWVDIVFTTP